MATRKPPSKKAADTPLPRADTPSAATADESPPMAASAGSGGPAAEAARQEAPTAQAEENAAPEARFHFFLIDTGWKSTAARVIRENFRMIREFQNDDPLYVLTREQSIRLIRENPDLIGKDPVILVHDLHAKGGRGESGYHGFRLCLGLVKNGQQALNAMQQFLRFVHNHRRSPDIEKDIRRQLHRQGMEGAIEVIREGAQELME